ncbi:zinc ribbon domain-containing protein [Comamonas thiooxydans]|uniref:Zinc ribbon domain-containing protein n=1 Tax=Comamonas thiooxydans TaxID=363952 RepID=A0AA42Q5G7_9BURK|nr:zinc ribbon domain-containing protein [Comamonas thiooxydans]MDH1336701.1 zinc ribbon domain-containing protein [Comamonas thiooxydans]MDH1742749.1 zinc ribbon domain-containing protein [Comamonas thiooxydans]MDH1789104.1 zinc ribbon domain-containing protein [Comamonas thiooxydans]
MREQPLGEIRFGTLARAAEGLTQWRPLLLCFLTLLLTGALIAGAAWMLVKAGFFMYLIFMLAAVVALLAGSSGVGIMLMDKARNEPVRSFSAAASAGLLCLPKFLLVGLAIFVATLAYYLLAAVIYFICKIPVLGGILAFVAHPILVLVAAALLIAMIWVVGPLMGPALWSGLSVKAALANVLSIARRRLVEVVLMEVVLYVILGLVCFMLFAGLVPATVSLTGMAMSITGDAGSMAGMFMGGGYGRGYGGGFNPMGMMGGGSTGLIAGLGVLYCVVGALLAQVAIMGMNLIYLQARESVDPAEAEGALDSLIGDVRKKAEEAKAQTMAAAERTMAAAERAKQAASERLQEATAKPAATDTPPGNDSNANAGAVTAAAATAGAAAAAAGLTAATAASTEQAFAEQQARERAAADAAEKARQSAEEAAARQRSEAEAARLRAEAEAARLKAEAEAAEQAARERATRERAAAEAQAAERAAQQKAAEERAVAQAAEEARQQAEAEQLARQQAAEREAARARAEAEAAEKARQAQAAPSCPACSAPVAANDLFCGECGNKLK